MLEIVILLFVLLAMYGHRKGGYPRRGRYSLRAVRVTPGITLSTLAGVTAIVANVTAAADGQYRAISLKTTWSAEGLTATEGPIVVGYAHSDYSVTEIKEFIESGTSISIGLKVEQERANRLIRHVGTISLATPELNDGNPIKTRLNWNMAPGVSVNIFAYNDNASALTTGGILAVNGTMWVKDA